MVTHFISFALRLCFVSENIRIHYNIEVDNVTEKILIIIYGKSCVKSVI